MGWDTVVERAHLSLLFGHNIMAGRTNQIDCPPSVRWLGWLPNPNKRVFSHTCYHFGSALLWHLCPAIYQSFLDIYSPPGGVCFTSTFCWDHKMARYGGAVRASCRMFDHQGLLSQSLKNMGLGSCCASGADESR